MLFITSHFPLLIECEAWLGNHLHPPQLTSQSRYQPARSGGEPSSSSACAGARGLPWGAPTPPRTPPYSRAWLCFYFKFGTVWGTTTFLKAASGSALMCQHLLHPAAASLARSDARKPGPAPWATLNVPPAALERDPAARMCGERAWSGAAGGTVPFPASFLPVGARMPCTIGGEARGQEGPFRPSPAARGPWGRADSSWLALHFLPPSTPRVFHRTSQTPLGGTEQTAWERPGAGDAAPAQAPALAQTGLTAGKEPSQQFRRKEMEAPGEGKPPAPRSQQGRGPWQGRKVCLGCRAGVERPVCRMLTSVAHGRLREVTCPRPPRLPRTLT